MKLKSVLRVLTLVLAAGSIAALILLMPFPPMWVILTHRASRLVGMDPVLFGASIVCGAFLAWNPQLFRGCGSIPRRSVVLLGMLIVASGVYALLSFEIMSRLVARESFTVICCINATIAVVLVFMSYHGRRRQGLCFATAFHWLLFAWAGTLALPWFAEGI